MYDTRAARRLFRQFVRALEADGFTLQRVRGSHRIYKHSDRRRAVVAYHALSDTFPVGTLRAMIREAGWRDEDLHRLGLTGVGELTAGHGEYKANTKALLFVRLCARLRLAVFNRCAMHGFASNVLSCRERERLEEELFETRTRGRYLSRLRNLSCQERVALDAREQAAQTRLAEHEVAHGCGR